MKQPAIYILASCRNGTLYIGVTAHLRERVWQHRQGLLDGFTKKYGVRQLVYFEFHEHMPAAIRREKQLKKWNRNWKIELIENSNPAWHDLWDELIG